MTGGGLQGKSPARRVAAGDSFAGPTLFLDLTYPSALAICSESYTSSTLPNKLAPRKGSSLGAIKPPPWSIIHPESLGDWQGGSLHGRRTLQEEVAVGRSKRHRPSSDP